MSVWLSPLGGAEINCRLWENSQSSYFLNPPCKECRVSTCPVSPALCAGLLCVDCMSQLFLLLYLEATVSVCSCTLVTSLHTSTFAPGPHTHIFIAAAPHPQHSAPKATTHTHTQARGADTTVLACKSSGGRKSRRGNVWWIQTRFSSEVWKCCCSDI